jgi:hypothetical protein
MRKALLFGLALALLVSACTAQEREEWAKGPVPICDTTSRGRLLLMAQSVPDASLIPCIGDLPPGWEFSAAHSRTSESVLVLTSDTFDVDVEVVLTASCDVTPERQVDSPRPETELFLGDGMTFSFVFTGGCIRFNYETAELAESTEGRALMEAIPFMTRQLLKEISGWTL